jgi:hypothetical protein
MKRILLLSFSLAFISFAQAQKNAKTTAYAITGVQKGSSAWTEVRLVDVSTGEEVQTVFQSANNAKILNARTKRPIAKWDDGSLRSSADKPFATNSAACAYDKKHDRLYYTPMGIAQLRYIDLKAKEPKVYYFEEEAFGVVKNRGDVASQITRMVIASDGNGYALSNNANHLIQFTTKKKQEIKDLGALTDDPANGTVSVHSISCYGGDMIADKNENIYLIGANRSVFKISLETRVATYVGPIKNLPKGYSTNGAIAEGDSKVIVSSSNSTAGYYRFDLNTLESEKVSGSNSVFNASDLASGALAFEKKDKKKEKPKGIKDEVATTITAIERRVPTEEAIVKNAITVYPNPVTDGYFRLSFADQKPGRYQVQFMDVAGKIISTQSVNVNNKVQVEEFRVPQKVAAGNYLVKVINENGSYSNINKIIVQ